MKLRTGFAGPSRDGPWGRFLPGVAGHRTGAPARRAGAVLSRRGGRWLAVLLFAALGWSHFIPKASAQDGCNPPVIVTQPANVTTTGCCPCVTFAVTVVGSAPITYRWEKDGLPIPGATDTTYTLCDVTIAQAGQYRVIVFNPCGLVSSATATLTVAPDVSPPRLLSATAACRTNKLFLEFDECLDPDLAQEPFSYVLDGGAINVLSASLLPDGRTVCLLLDSPFTVGAAHTLSVQGLADRCGNALPMATLDFEVLCDDCQELSQETVECVPGAAGLFSWTFRLTNLSTNAVKYIYLIPATNCFTLTPPVTILAAPLATGQSATLNATLTVATNCGTNVCFYVSTHDPRFVLCCSQRHCLDLATLAGPPRLRIAHAPPNVIITWTGCGILQCTTALGEPWTDVPGASSPYTVPATDAKKFYRLRL